MFPVTVICEGSSENAYLQSLNRILRCTNYSWNVGPFIPRVAHQGYYGSVIAKLKEEQQRNRKSTFHVWVDRDIYIRNTKNSQTNYQQKPKNIPNFFFSTMNFEDFLMLHCKDSLLNEWIAICVQHHHFNNPMTEADYMPLYRSLLPNYKKGELPFDLTKDRVSLMLDRLERPKNPFANDFGMFLSIALTNGEIEFIA